jgi:hypothetical protein
MNVQKNVFHIRLSLFLKQLDTNEEDILRIIDELLLRRSFILVLHQEDFVQFVNLEKLKMKNISLYIVHDMNCKDEYL